MVMCHAIGGTVLFYHHLARGLTGNRPLHAIQAQGLEDGETPIDDVRALAARSLALVETRIDATTVHLGGYSFGCFVALEMARLMESSGRTPRRLLLLAPSPFPSPETSFDIEVQAQDLLKKFLRGFDGIVPRRYKERLLSVYRAHLGAYNNYKYEPIRTPHEVFFPTDEIDGESEWSGPDRANVRTWRVAGDHKSMIRAPHVKPLGIKLEEVLREPAAGSSSIPGPITARVRKALTQ